MRAQYDRHLPTQGDLTQLRDRLMVDQHKLDDLILYTPTGPARNALTEANIHIMEALEALARGVHK